MNTDENIKSNFLSHLTSLPILGYAGVLFTVFSYTYLSVYIFMTGFPASLVVISVKDVYASGLFWAQDFILGFSIAYALMKFKKIDFVFEFINNKNFDIHIFNVMLIIGVMCKYYYIYVVIIFMIIASCMIEKNIKKYITETKKDKIIIIVCGIFLLFCLIGVKNYNESIQFKYCIYTDNDRIEQCVVVMSLENGICCYINGKPAFIPQKIISRIEAIKKNQKNL